MTAFYNEHDPYAAQYLRNLMAAGLIAPGVVDERDIQEIEAWELSEFTQVHMFAGIGIWSGALRAAGWPDDEPIWTGSCPCQPFSAAGKKKGFSDDRHLWPFWRSLIAQCRPTRVAGEQVASKDGKIWLDIVSTDLEALGIAFGASDLCAAGFGGAHIRQREYFVGLADAQRFRYEMEIFDSGSSGAPIEQWEANFHGVFGASGRLADCDHAGLERRAGMLECRNQLPIGARGVDDRMGDALLNGNGAVARNHDKPEKEIIRNDGNSSRSCPASKSAGAVSGLEHPNMPDKRGGWSPGGEQSLHIIGNVRNATPSIRYSGETLPQYWYDVDWLLCRNPSGEPSWRPVRPGTFPLAHGVAARMGKLRAYGNALDFETAKGFCEILVEICLGL
jgi:DNA (cytosine-5)-methyltransferase 1